MKANTIILSMAILLGMSSCTKVIDLDLENKANTVVIEGEINDGLPPYQVKITKSVAFTENNNYPGINNALVIVEDNTGVRDTLQSKSDGVYETNKIIGTPGNTYSLTAIADGKTYTSQSTLPAKVTLDTLLTTELNFAGQKRKTIIPGFLDPMTIGNNYRFIISVNDTIVKDVVITNDNINNGIPNQRPFILQSVILKSGDAVKVTMQNVDKLVYNYFYTLQQISGNGPGGGSAPTNPPSNIIGGALGYFNATSSNTKTVVIP
jgi:hypothetical protein